MMRISVPMARRTVSHSRASSSRPKPSFSLMPVKSFADALMRLLDQIGERVAAPLTIEASGIGLAPVAQRAADQAMHRQAEMPALQIPQRDVDCAQRFDREALLAVVAQPIIEALPMPLGGERILPNQQRLVELYDRSGQPRRAERLAPAAVAVLSDDLDKAGAAPFVPGLRIGEGLGQRCFENVDPDVPDLKVAQRFRRRRRSIRRAAYRPASRRSISAG